jgi:hypothetical protein
VTLLVMRKAFGRAAGIASLVSSVSLIVAMLTLGVLIRVQILFPVLILLGPLIVLQFAYWRRRIRRERRVAAALAY